MTILRDRSILVSRSVAADGRILTFLTASAGKVRLYYRLFPRRVRREFFDCLQGGELLYTPATVTAPGRLHAFACDELWPGVRSDFSLIVHALHFADLAALFMQEGESSPGVFNTLRSFLVLLEAPCAPDDLRIVFQLQLLALSGFAPSIQRCISCRSPAKEGAGYFSPRGGGIVCAGCASSRREPVRRLSAGALAIMQRSLSIAPERAGRLRLGSDLRRELEPLMDDILESVLEKQPLSTLFLRRLQGGRALPRQMSPLTSE